ncbi:hypothetical protein KAFR_0J01420 [Kazachstania africana CBS 2517]|uniref:Uncharacterized protein n=1 Tax=Kazachstania africana (strain ATCC 22294 / BCRC 22015 / CBS 2517 / CECT 1963 / NBRC 1671 / NRRL Y-8276) TaxID=1071382 RepID=H2B0Q9_KAZAF|nr:hypothetical protein KAFR_0J01420 [Kazachstania africana CBS 2517]CCF60209.1 hypothetical protein KAFR_0J01420 [Kazachstania africana CBS 2517]
MRRNRRRVTARVNWGGEENGTNGKETIQIFCVSKKLRQCYPPVEPKPPSSLGLGSIYCCSSSVHRSPTRLAANLTLSVCSNGGGLPNFPRTTSTAIRLLRYPATSSFTNLDFLPLPLQLRRVTPLTPPLPLCFHKPFLSYLINSLITLLYIYFVVLLLCFFFFLLSRFLGLFSYPE